MAIPDFVDVVLDRLVAIDALIGNITIKGQSVAINAIRTTHAGSLPQDKLPLLYTEPRPAATFSYDANGKLLIEREYVKWLVIANLAQDYFTDDGSQGLLDTYAAETTLLAHYLARPRLQVTTNSGALPYLWGGDNAVLPVSFGGQVFTREIPPDRTQERWAGITLTLRIIMTYSLEDGLLG